MGHPQFDNDDFLIAARDVVLRQGPAAVTVGSVTKRVNAPTGSFYHRFASRDVLLGELWLCTILLYQEGLTEIVERGDWLALALYPCTWARANMDDACLLLLHHQDDFVRGGWPNHLKKGVTEQARRVENYVRRFARAKLGRAGADELRRAKFILIDVPIAAVRPHLKERQAPPMIVDDLIRATYRAVVDEWRTSRKR